MSTVREQVADQIKTDNALYNVYPFPKSAPDNLGKTKVQVSVYRSDLQTLSENPNALQHNLIIEVLVGQTVGDKAEDALDDALDNVLLSLQRIQGAQWSTAERTVFDEKYIGYKINASAYSDNVYQSIVLTDAKNEGA